MATVLLLVIGTDAARATPTPPPNFEDSLVATVARPTALAFTPDGRMLITTLTGQVRVYKNGGLLPTPALDLSGRICNDSERGVLGLAVSPSFASDHHIYVYYTFKRAGTCEYNTANSPVNRVSRFTLSDDDTIDPASEVVLIDNIPSPSGTHNGGDLQFGKDGLLYVSVGDGGCDYTGDSGCALLNDAARDLSVLSGKILRITAEGGIPATNPYQGANTARCNTAGRTDPPNTCQEIYAWGLRNPFRMAFDPNASGTQFYINDVGQSKWEEIDVGQAGADYGWNVREGHCAANSATNCGPPPLGMTNPIYDYDHGAGCSSITGGAFVPAGTWPPEYDGAYLFADLTCGKFFRLVPEPGGGYTAIDFITDAGNIISATFGPHRNGSALYYLNWQLFPNDQIRRVAYTDTANRAPVAAPSAAPTSGSLPLNVAFDASDSSDPDGDPLSFEWDFGDGSPHGSGASPSHTYTTAGVYTATVTVRDGRGGEDSESMRIDAGNNPPTPAIQSPTAGQRFRVGEPITLTAAASDPEDGTLPDGAFFWEVIRHHSTHVHPYLNRTYGNNVPITGPAPEDLSATTNSYLEIKLTATDSGGLERTVSREFHPKLVDLTFTTAPDGLQLQVAGETITGPAALTSWDSWRVALNAPRQTDSSGRDWELQAWSDGGATSHTITTPSTPATYSANFRRPYDRPGAASTLGVSLVPAFRQTIDPPQCASRGGAGSTHGPPFSFTACNPPAYLPGTAARLGPDSSASATITPVPGDLGTSGDEADLALTLDATDIRDLGSGSDYDPSPTGPDVTLVSKLRLSDTASGPTMVDSATTIDFELPIAVGCTPTASSALGSTCSASTSVDSVTPGAIGEGRRSVFQIFRARVEDAGGNGTRGDADDRAFAHQGIFVP